MTRCRLVWVTAAVCLALAVYLAVRAAPKLHSVNRANFARVQLGMTQAEVEAMLRCPPGDYTTEENPDGWFIPSASIGNYVGMRGHGEPAAGTFWVSDHGNVGVWFGGDGQAKYAQFSGFVPTEPRWASLNLRARLGW